MRWFSGSIPEAIAFAKQHNAVFIVFIRGDDEQSTQMAASWEAEEVAEATVNSFVAIKIDAKSETCVQFSQIYPVVCIPSSFFIGDNGIPLEVVAGSVTAVELVARIQKVKEMHRQKNVAAAGDNQENHVGQSQASEFPENTQPNVPQVSDTKTTETMATTALQVRPKESPSKMPGLKDHSDHAGPSGNCCFDETSASSQVGEDLNARVERLTKKLEERREQKKEDELTVSFRIDLFFLPCKEMVEFKRKQEEDRTKRMLEERSRDKEEERLARERIRQQIALDRAERAARYAKTQEEALAAKRASQQRRINEESRNKEERKETSKMCRIQFRLPDGSSFTNQFQAEATLAEARQFAESQVGGLYGHFELAITFPRKQFTKDDYIKTLTELELVPSASIILIPGGRSPSSMVRASEGGLWTVLNALFYPVIAVWRFISNYLFASNSTQRASRGSLSQPENSRVSSSSASDTDREVRRRRLLEKRGEDFKREGRVYRLRTEDDADDDNNTWNGNSTQQM
ncbi:LOW QUALITY PROTEIN: UBX domain-containing protein 4 [Scyliorhinus canicula]|uniref:LOW QUALITY PROTEIN: UBX domain-containing protein 4 n=1 Tax=Scyliorhinus canicula TaxID=7830 RepID=UPI0018F3F368|nr:LOW QUALITY PROTEIN: UBX domain-containing protein 4 [Scyliorhinus canicula]